MRSHKKRQSQDLNLSNLTQKSILLTTSNDNSGTLAFIFVTVGFFFFFFFAPMSWKPVRDKEVKCQSLGHTGSHHPSLVLGSCRYMTRNPFVGASVHSCSEKPHIMDQVLTSMLVLTSQREASRGPLYGSQHICNEQKEVFADLMMPQLIRIQSLF